jgi:O-antigen/teichoic acid export membrane protein
MGTFMAIISVMAPVAALSYPVAIVLPKSNNDAKGLIKLSLLITVIISLLVFILLLLFKHQIVSIFQLEEISVYLYLIPIVLALAGLLQVIEQWLVRTKQFSVSAKATLLQSIIVNSGKLGIGFFHPAAAVLILFTSLRQGVKSFLLLLLTKNINKGLLKAIPKEKVTIKKLAKKYRDFPIFRTPEILLNAISGNLPILLLTSFFGPVSAGFYVIGRSVLNIPSQLIGKSVGDVFYPRITEASNNNENLAQLIKKATLSLATVGAIPYGIVIMFGPWLFGFVFGEEWVTAGEYARWISLMSYFMFINRPSVVSLPVLSAQRFHLIYTIFVLITRILVLLVGFYVFKSDLVAVALFGVSGAVLNIGLILITLAISKKYNRTHEKV